MLVMVMNTLIDEDADDDDADDDDGDDDDDDDDDGDGDDDACVASCLLPLPPILAP